MGITRGLLWSTGDDYQPLPLDLAMQRWLAAGGVRRVCSGHLTLESRWTGHPMCRIKDGFRALWGWLLDVASWPSGKFTYIPLYTYDLMEFHHVFMDTPLIRLGHFHQDEVETTIGWSYGHVSDATFDWQRVMGNIRNKPWAIQNSKWRFDPF